MTTLTKVSCGLIFYELVIILDQEKGREAWKRGREEGAHCEISITIRKRQKTLTLYQISSSFMTLKEIHLENVGGENGKKYWL